MYEVAEKFVSINGEGMKAGQLAAFIRFKGCNLNCSYCDTLWAKEENCKTEKLSKEDIYAFALSTGARNITLTGGEPLTVEGIETLIEYLSHFEDIRTEIETNGSKDISFTKKYKNRPSVTLDYKTPSSGMEKYMLMSNYEYVDKGDCVKFVCGSREDLEKSRQITDFYRLRERTNVYISTVFGSLTPREAVEYLIENKLRDVNIQLQLHKYIWAPDTKGV
ncbi:MAG: putative 7-carboxy-7-deazaguanine synthase QueE [Firmicutes bacterium]|nr:putative 7-carboxy-7-deazaguanine synthase QueE [Bacillota bacterium]